MLPPMCASSSAMELKATTALRQASATRYDRRVEAVYAFVLAYLLGSIPFGLILTRIAGTRDLREVGSGSIGATNVLRAGGKGLAAATLLLDLLKGLAAVLIAWRWFPDGVSWAALGVVIGHCFPVWLKFR